MGPYKSSPHEHGRDRNEELVPGLNRGTPTGSPKETGKPLPESDPDVSDMLAEKPFSCPFCNPAREYIVLSNDLCYARWDINPVSRGHLLIIPFRHVSDFFDTTPKERNAIMDLAAGSSRAFLQEKFHPSGYNFGVNIGEAAGQVIGHVHFHLIPRYHGDARSKPNGMRNVIPKMHVKQHHLPEYFSGTQKQVKKESGRL
jgi:diadenosine tetraphosphate (Ap4A) HIT family hydrolase